MELKDIKINLDFENLIPRQTAEQFKQLEENMVADGRARNPLVIWKGKNTLVDGHHRVKILKAHPELRWSVVEQEFADEEEVKEWIIKNALGTRNLTQADWMMLMSALYKMRKKKAGAPKRNANASKQCAQNEHIEEKEPSRISEQIAKELGVARETVKRAEWFADGLEAADAIVPGTKEKVIAGELKAQKSEVMAWRKQTPEEIKKSVDVIKDRKRKRASPDKELARKIREIAADARSVSTTGYGLAELIREVDALGDSFLLSLSSMIKRRKDVMDSYDDGAEQISSCVDDIIEKLNELKKGF